MRMGTSARTWWYAPIVAAEAPAGRAARAAATVRNVVAVRSLIAPSLHRGRRMGKKAPVRTLSVHGGTTSSHRGGPAVCFRTGGGGPQRTNVAFAVRRKQQ